MVSWVFGGWKTNLLFSGHVWKDMKSPADWLWGPCEWIAKVAPLFSAFLFSLLRCVTWFCCHKNMNRGTNKHQCQYLSTSSATKLGGVELRNFDEQKPRRDSEGATIWTKDLFGSSKEQFVSSFSGLLHAFVPRMTKTYESAIWSNTIPLYTCLNMTYLNLYGYPRPLVNEPIDLPSLRLAAWYFENHWSSTISPCDPGSPPRQ